MHWRIVTVGKPALPWARDGVVDYLQRLSRRDRVEMVHLRSNAPKHIEEQMLRAGEGCVRVALDEHGKQRRSAELADWIRHRELAGTKRVCVFVGSSDGLALQVRESADEVWSLSNFTLQHELALVILLEQIYRAYAILRNEPYHRA